MNSFLFFQELILLKMPQVFSYLQGSDSRIRPAPSATFCGSGWYFLLCCPSQKSWHPPRFCLPCTWHAQVPRPLSSTCNASCIHSFPLQPTALMFSEKNSALSGNIITPFLLEVSRFALSKLETQGSRWCVCVVPVWRPTGLRPGKSPWFSFSWKAG